MRFFPAFRLPVFLLPLLLQPGGGRAWPLPGYWSNSEFQAPIACKIPSACPGNAGPLSENELARNTQLCAEQYAGTACGQCADGFYFLSGRCYRCGGDAASQNKQLAGVMIAAVIVMSILSLGVAFLHPAKLSLIVMVIVIVQEMTEVGAVGAKDLPVGAEAVSWFFGAVSLINFNIQIIRPGCGSLPPLNYVSIFWITVGMVCVTGCMFVLACLARLWVRIQTETALRAKLSEAEIVVMRKKRRDLLEEEMDGMNEYQRQQAINMYLDPWIDFKMRITHSMLILFTFFYLKLSTMCFALFQCTEAPTPQSIYDNDPFPTYSSLLIADYQTPCWSSAHLATVILACLLLIFYVLGFPLLCYILLVRAFADETTHGLSGYLWRRWPRVFRDPDLDHDMSKVREKRMLRMSKRTAKRKMDPPMRDRDFRDTCFEFWSLCGCCCCCCCEPPGWRYTPEEEEDGIELKRTTTTLTKQVELIAAAATTEKGGVKGHARTRSHRSLLAGFKPTVKVEPERSRSSAWGSARSPTSPSYRASLGNITLRQNSMFGSPSHRARPRPLDPLASPSGMRPFDPNTPTRPSPSPDYSPGAPQTPMETPVHRTESTDGGRMLMISPKSRPATQAQSTPSPRSNRLEPISPRAAGSRVAPAPLVVFHLDGDVPSSSVPPPPPAPPAISPPDDVDSAPVLTDKKPQHTRNESDETELSRSSNTSSSENASSEGVTRVPSKTALSTPVTAVVVKHTGKVWNPPEANPEHEDHDAYLDYRRMALFGYLFMELKQDHFYTRMEMFGVNLWFALVNSYDTDTRSNLFLLGLCFALSCLLVCWHWPFIRRIDNLRAGFIAAISLTQVTIMLGVQSDSSQSGYFLALICCFFLICLAVVLRKKLFFLIAAMCCPKRIAEQARWEAAEDGLAHDDVLPEEYARHLKMEEEAHGVKIIEKKAPSPLLMPSPSPPPLPPTEEILAPVPEYDVEAVDAGETADSAGTSVVVTQETEPSVSKQQQQQQEKEKEGENELEKPVEEPKQAIVPMNVAPASRPAVPTTLAPPKLLPPVLPRPAPADDFRKPSFLLDKFNSNNSSFLGHVMLTRPGTPTGGAIPLAQAAGTPPSGSPQLSSRDSPSHKISTPVGSTPPSPLPTLASPSHRPQHSRTASISSRAMPTNDEMTSDPLVQAHFAALSRNASRKLSMIALLQSKQKQEIEKAKEQAEVYRISKAMQQQNGEQNAEEAAYHVEL
jgi:hypothetical protein